MIVVSGREFRASQAKYLDHVANGEDVILKSRRGTFRIIPVTKDDTVYNDKELTEMIDRSLEQIRRGEGYAMLPDETAEQFLQRLLTID